MHRGIWGAAVVGIGLLAGSAGIHALPPHGAHGHVHGANCLLGGDGTGPCPGLMMLHHVLQELNLTEEQHEALHETLKSHRADLAKVIRPVVEAKRGLCDAVLAESPDEAAIRKAAAVVGTSAGEAAVVAAKIKSELIKKAKLTPEQMKKLTDHRAQGGASIDAFLKRLEQQH